MGNTKEKILSQSLSLFNKEGLAKVTLRTIARAMNISQGNLNYHFKKREDIIETLYHQLVKRIDEALTENQGKEPCLKLLVDISTTIMNSFYDYRFFFLDFVQIMREHESIKAHYLKLSEMRKMQFNNLFKVLIDNGVLREEQLPKEYVYLYDRFQIIGDFWISSAEVVNKRMSKKYIDYYSEVITQAIYPYLTDRGKKEYHAIFNGN
ncbi:TetR/AcrR family transcriptional regulator [Yeosuana marina]|uniref:TetR/AcrR family transcriptional regulator n=1 Tax=Yeosuana marina TaxID=1565536 RepID=UPI00142168EC|nr:TetR/AcrR family transcriptional regulator [Yeosuana marina]